MRLGDRIRELRKKRKMSLTDLAELSNVQLAVLSRIENYRMLGTIDAHDRIAKALGISLSGLYKDVTIELDESYKIRSEREKKLSRLDKKIEETNKKLEEYSVLRNEILSSPR